MSALGSLVVSISLEYAAYTQGLDKTSQQALAYAKNTQDAFDKAERSFKNYATSTVKELAGVGIALTGLSNASQLFADSIRFADSINDIAKANEIGVGSLLRFSEALSLSGGEAANADKVFSAFSSSVDAAAKGSESTRSRFQSLGITLKDIATLDTQTLFEKTLLGLNSINDPLTRNASAADLLGKAVKGVDIQGLAQEYSANNQNFADAEKAFNGIGDALDRLDKLQAKAKTSIATNFAPVLIGVTEAIDNLLFGYQNLEKKVFQERNNGATGFKFAERINDPANKGSFNIPPEYQANSPAIRDVVETADQKAARLKAESDAKAAARKAASDAEAAKRAYDSLTDSINKQIEAKRAEYSITGPLSESEKILLDINLRRADGQLKLTNAQYANLQALLSTLDAESQNAEMSALRLQSEKDYLAIIESVNAARDEQTQSMIDETSALEAQAQAKVDEIQQLSMTREQLEALQQARFDEQIGVLETQKSYLQSQPDREYEIELIQRQIDALNVLRDSVGKTDAINRAKDDVNAIFGSMEQTARLAWTVFANSGDSAAQAVGKSIKASILDLLYQMTIKKFFIQVQASMSPTGAINDLTGPVTGNPNASIIERIGDGFKSINTTFSSSIEKLGAFLSNGQGGLADKIGGFLKGYSSQIASGISYLGAGYMLSQGNIAGAALTAAGTFFGGPLGGAIGGAIGSLFGKKPSTPRYSSGVDTTFANGQFASTDLFGLAGFKKDAGGRDGLSKASKVFSETLNGLLSAFDISSSINTRLEFFKRKGAWGFASAMIDGVSTGTIGGDSVYSKDSQEAFNNLINQFLSTGVVNAIKVSRLPEGIKGLFDNLSDQTQISNMITASVNLANNQDSLAKAYNLNADLAGKVATASGLAGDSLVAFVNALTTASVSQQTAAYSMLKERDALTQITGVVPTTVKAFDEMLKAINTSTLEGQTKFASMFTARDRVSSWSSAMDTIKTSMDNAKFSLLSQTEQMAISQQKLAEAFAEVNAEVPGSRDELVKWVNGLDLTTEAGLKAAMAVPALVEAFQAIEENANSTTNALREMSRFSNLADYRFYKGVANNYGAQIANDYARASGVITPDASGKATVNGADVNVLAELKAMRKASDDQTSVLNRILKMGLPVKVVS